METKFKNKIAGNIGEVMAVDFLEKKKYEILEINYKIKLGEIDIIAFKDKTIVFVEVKRRLTLKYGRPAEAVGFYKQRQIRRVAEYYLMMKNQTYSDVRFDVIEILDDEINHIENAF